MMNYYKVHIKSIVEKDPSGFRNITHDINRIKFYYIDYSELINVIDMIGKKSLLNYGSLWLSNDSLIIDIDHSGLDIDTLENKIRKIIKKMLLREHLINEILK